MTVARFGTDNTTRFYDLHAAEMTANDHRCRRAARVVASHSASQEDCVELLGMLGLSDAAGRPLDPRNGLID